MTARSASAAEGAAGVPDVAVRPARATDAAVLESLFQLYCHDFSELLGVELDERGRFPEKSFAPYWSEPGRHAFLVRVGGRIAGFALVHQGSRLSGDTKVWDMAEFFVVRRHRRSGVGAAAAQQLFRAFAGRWEVRETPTNVAATAFWRRVIAAYTGGAFTDTVVDDERWRGPVQAFVSGVGGAG